MLEFLLFIIKWIFIVLSPFLLSLLLHFLYYYFVKNMRFKQGEYKYIGYRLNIKKITYISSKTNSNR